MSIGTLYIEELRATMRGRFALVGAGVILLAVGCVATVGTQDTWLDGYGIIAYFLVPLAFIPLAAVFLASPRANRFVESVFTAPVDRRDWLAAKILVLVTTAAAYYAALVPMVLVYTHHVGAPLLLQKLLIWAPCLLLASIAVGTLIGVLFIGQSIAAPAATGVGILLAYAGFVPLQELLVAQGNGATRTGHLTLLSPAVLLKNAFGFTLAVGSIPATTTRTWISLLAVVIGALALAVWAFLRAQGVETWEASWGQRWTIALGIVLIVVLPVLLADTNYDKPAPHATNAPSIQRLFARAGSSLALTQPGGQPPARCCSTILNRDEWPPLGTDEPTRESQSTWTAREYLSYFARIRHMPNPEEEVERILDDVGLDPKFRGKLICTYSTGMKRRVEIARALMGRPKVLFLDEPTRGLDLPAKRDMWSLLRRLAAKENVTTFLSSHDAQEIRSLCSEISVIARGRLVHTGATRELGGDIDAFEERLVQMLTQSETVEPAGLHFRAG
jgi:ABC-type oligopeptide transport system ATPase subunit